MSKGATYEDVWKLHQRLEQMLAVSGCLLGLARDEEGGAATSESLGRMYSLSGAMETLLELTLEDARYLPAQVQNAQTLRLIAQKNQSSEVQGGGESHPPSLP